MTCKDTPDFIYPMLADIYYAIVKQSEYGQPQKDWVYDRTVICNLTSLVRKGMEETIPDAYVKLEGRLSGIVKEDIRISSHNSPNATTNILITNIRDAGNVPIYTESAGPRAGRPTIYEVAAVEPFFSPFEEIDYYNVSIRRTENQAVGD